MGNGMARVIYTEEGSYIADDITAMGAAKRAAEREARQTEREADESREEWHAAREGA